MQAYAAFRNPAYRFYSAGNFASVLGRQMLVVAVQYEIFRRTQSATALGLVGLAAALPVIFLALPAGQMADRRDRRSIIITTQLLGFGASLLLALVAGFGDRIPAYPILVSASGALQSLAAFFGESGHAFSPDIPVIFLLLFLNGILRTFGWAARAPFLTNLVPRESLANAVTWNSSLFEIGCVVGPALAGFLLAHFSFSLVCVLDATCCLLFVLFLLPVRGRREQEPPHELHPLEDLFSGMRFVWQNKAILATITLDLFAVLLGGAVALLPIFAEKILFVGPVGFGWLRAAQSIGAIAMAVTLAHLPPMRRAGWTLLLAVSGFGLATIVFGLSRSFWGSLVALALIGAFDNISVVVRHTLVQLWTPDNMRGRVAAVNNIFIGSSNELGAFESGITAAYFGPVVSVVGGGIGTILIVCATALKWPEIRRIGTLSPPPGRAGPPTAESATELGV
jgi:MFS family permease